MKVGLGAESGGAIFEDQGREWQKLGSGSGLEDVFVFDSKSELGLGLGDQGLEWEKCAALDHVI